MIFKNFWAHRKQNGFVFVEIALIAVLSFYLIDHITLYTYSTYFCHADGEFEKEHLLVAQTARVNRTPISEKAAEDADSARLKTSEQEAVKTMSNLHAFCDEIRKLPEVQSVSLVQSFIGDGQDRWNYHAMAAEADTGKTCSTCISLFCQDECYVETMGITATEGSPSVEKLSSETPTDGVVLTRSLALQLFGTPEAVGRRVVMIQYKPGPDAKDVEFVTHHTVTGVVEDVKPISHERRFFIAFFPVTGLSTDTPRMLIRLKPEVDAEAFMAKNSKVGTDSYAFGWLYTYKDFQKKYISRSDDYIILTLLGTLGLLFALNVVLGTLGTFWLQIRKRTEEFGIMRSFGAKRRHLFWMIWGEGALLTFFACLVGQLIWLQFALSIQYGMNDGHLPANSSQATDILSYFWPHFLIVCVVQYFVLLVIVTLGIIVPAFIAMNKRPVEALRHE